MAGCGVDRPWAGSSTSTRRQPKPLVSHDGRVLEPDRLHTGDHGVLDTDGYLRLVGRKKELIVNAAGHNMSPSAIEAVLLAETPLIAQVCVLGDGRPFNVALMTVGPAVARDDATRAAVAEAVVRANTRLSAPEGIEDFVLLEDMWIPGTDELTPTMKVRRPAVAERYRYLVEQMYTHGGSRGQ